MRWVGIDEAGYGPNLGPLVIAAVGAEGPGDTPPSLWADLSPKVSRAGGPRECLWIDDSKAIYQAGKGRDRLFETAFATLLAAGHSMPTTMSQWLGNLSAGSLDDTELTLWADGGADPDIAEHVAGDRLSRITLDRHFECASWKLVFVRAVVVGPWRFNQDLDATGSKSGAHFRAFSRLLAPLWTAAETTTFVRSDKHGGRHYYLGPLSESFPDAWIDRGVEGPILSRYTMRGGLRRLVLELCPRADAEDGLVALASITAKAVREAWMSVFNAFWQRKLPGLKPTAGYPTDAKRFRRSIEPLCSSFGLTAKHWWRLK